MEGTKNPAVLHRHSHLWEVGTPEVFRHRLQTWMSRATPENSTAGLDQTLRTGPGLWVIHGISRLCIFLRTEE